MMVAGDANGEVGFPGAYPGHQPVLLQECLDLLRVNRGGRFLDGTFGGGGHTRAILEANQANEVVAVDRDPEALARSGEIARRFGNRFRFVRGEFSAALAECGTGFNGMLFDLGVSSFQLDDAERGFSFRNEAPLDMRMDYSSGTSAAEFLESASEEDLIRAVRDYGEEPSWRRVVKGILAVRGTGALATTSGFAGLVESVLGGRTTPGRRPVHPATRTFQGVRIAVNDELGALERLLPEAFARLAPRGVLVVISFHSLEDRIVKRYFRKLAGRPEHAGDARFQDERETLGELLSTKPVTPGSGELERNPRARSAKLRCVRKLSEAER